MTYLYSIYDEIISLGCLFISEGQEEFDIHRETAVFQSYI